MREREEGKKKRGAASFVASCPRERKKRYELRKALISHRGCAHIFFSGPVTQEAGEEKRVNPKTGAAAEQRTRKQRE